MTDLFARHLNTWLAGIERTPEPEPLPPQMVRLDRNERIEPYPPEVVTEILSRLGGPQLSRYPDSSALYRTLADVTSLPPDRLLLVPGSDAAFRSLAHALIEPGDRVAMIDPSYQMYPIYVRMFGGIPVPVSVGDDLTVDPAALAKATTTSKMLWLANPNQPSGTLVPIDRVRLLARAAADTSTLVVVDEAYYPFSGATILDEVIAHDNLVVVRSFSKAYGLAGVRLGFVAGPPTIVGALFKVRASFDINALAIAAAEWTLDHPEAIAAYVRETHASAALLRDLAARRGLFAPPSAANFQLIKTRPSFDPADVKRACWDEGYAISGPAGRGLFADYVRVTTGSVAVIERFAQTLDRVLDTLDRRSASGDRSHPAGTLP
jgi:histidinol-phosphate aminotransferase